MNLFSYKKKKKKKKKKKNKKKTKKKPNKNTTNIEGKKRTSKQLFTVHSSLLYKLKYIFLEILILRIINVIDRSERFRIYFRLHTKEKYVGFMLKTKTPGA